MHQAAAACASDDYTGMVLGVVEEADECQLPYACGTWDVRPPVKNLRVFVHPVVD